MKLTCPICRKEYDGRINKNDQSWYGTCPECGDNFKLVVPEGRIIMAFTDPLDTLPTDPYYGIKELPEEIDIYQYFTEDFTGQGIHTLYAFDTIDEFMKKWSELIGKPNGMWYWVIDEGAIVCSGAMDPGDIDIFIEFWDLEAKKYVL